GTGAGGARGAARHGAGHGWAGADAGLYNGPPAAGCGMERGPRQPGDRLGVADRQRVSDGVHARAGASGAVGRWGAGGAGALAAGDTPEASVMIDGLLLFLLMLKAALFSTSGIGNLPILHQDLLSRGWATDRNFTESLAIGQISPGPSGLWVISLGYLLDGLRGALFALI